MSKESSTGSFQARESLQAQSSLQAKDPLHLHDLLRANGYRLTRQRQLVLEVLRETQGHPDAEMIFNLAKTRDPKISLATIYRTLAMLNEAGLINKHHLGEDHGHFETAQTTPHYHFTCLHCERVIEFEAPEVTKIGQRLCEQEGIQITEVHLHYSGYCPNCLAKSFSTK